MNSPAAPGCGGGAKSKPAAPAATQETEKKAGNGGGDVHLDVLSSVALESAPFIKDVEPVGSRSTSPRAFQQKSFVARILGHCGGALEGDSRLRHAAELKQKIRLYAG